jgi:hypothetical protein
LTISVGVADLGQHDEGLTLEAWLPARLLEGLTRVVESSAVDELTSVLELSGKAGCGHEKQSEGQSSHPDT